MYLDIDNVRFRFIRVPNKQGQKVDTICQVKPKQWPAVGWANAGYARINPQDLKEGRFNKATGKIVAMSHALDSMDMSFEFGSKAMDTLVVKLRENGNYFSTEWKWLNQLIYNRY